MTDRVMMYTLSDDIFLSEIRKVDNRFGIRVPIPSANGMTIGSHCAIRVKCITSGKVVIMFGRLGTDTSEGFYSVSVSKLPEGVEPNNIILAKISESNDPIEWFNSDDEVPYMGAF